MVPAGYIYIKELRENAPAICEDWVDELWHASLSRMRFGGQIALILYTGDRLKSEKDKTLNGLSIWYSIEKAQKYELVQVITT